MRSPVRPLVFAAIAVPLLATGSPAAAEELFDYQDAQATFTSTRTGDEVHCTVSAYTSREHEDSPYTTTESSGDFAECYEDVRVEVHATWIDEQGRTVRLSRSQRSFLMVIRLENVVRDLAVRHEVTYGQCDRDDVCHYELETATK